MNSVEDLRTDLLFARLWHLRARRADPHARSDLADRLTERLLRSHADRPGRVIAIPSLAPDQVRSGEWKKYAYKQPVVLRGLINDTKACQNWSLDWFSENYPNYRVAIADYLKDIDEMVHVMENKIPLKHAVELVRRDPRKGLRACGDIMRQHPELREQLDTKRFAEITGRAIVYSDMWMSNCGIDAITPFHTAGAETFASLIKGEKRWTLVPPRHTKFMYGEAGRSDAAITYDSQLPGCPTDEHESLFAEFPLFRFADRYVADLEAGDVMYFPPWWWHHIENTSETLAASHRTMPALYMPEPFALFFYVLMVTSRPRLILEAARGTPISDDAFHLADFSRN